MRPNWELALPLFTTKLFILDVSDIDGNTGSVLVIDTQLMPDVLGKQLGGKQWQCQLPVRTHSAAIIAREAYRLFERSYRWEYPIRSVTVRAINLCSQDLPEQLQFFSDAATVEQKEKLETVIEEIRGRFGKYAIQPACLCQDIKMPTDREVELRMPTGMIG